MTPKNSNISRTGEEGERLAAMEKAMVDQMTEEIVKENPVDEAIVEGFRRTLRSKQAKAKRRRANVVATKQKEHRNRVKDRQQQKRSRRRNRG